MMYGSENYVTTESMMAVLGVFHHCIAQRIKGKTVWHIRTEIWVWPPVE